MLIMGIAVGGEWGGAALMALGHSAKGERGFAASFTNAGAPTGAALGTFVLGLFAAMPEEQFLSWGWCCSSPSPSRWSPGRPSPPVVWYPAGTAVVSAVFILLTRESKDFDLETHEH